MKVSEYIADMRRYVFYGDQAVKEAVESFFLDVEESLDMKRGIDINIYDFLIKKEKIEYDEEDRSFYFEFVLTHEDLEDDLHIERAGYCWDYDAWDVFPYEQVIRLGSDNLI